MAKEQVDLSLDKARLRTAVGQLDAEAHALVHDVLDLRRRNAAPARAELGPRAEAHGRRALLPGEVDGVVVLGAGVGGRST